MNHTGNTPMTQGTADAVLLPVPALPPEKRTPAAVHSIALIKKDDTYNTMRIVIKRDTSIAIENFTFRYRFSKEPVYAPDSENPFHTYCYTDDDLNSSEFITITGDIPAMLTKNGCSAYISEVKLVSGQIIAFEAADYRLVRRPVKRTPGSIEKSEAEAQAQTRIEMPKPPRPRPSEKTKKRRRIAILSSLFLILAVEIAAGVFLSKYLGVKKSADSLISDRRYNEAYKIALDAGHPSILQRVCEKAVEFYISKGDLESAYVYAYGAPHDALTDVIIDYAASCVIDATTGKINENAFAVAKMSNAGEKFSAMVRSVCDILSARGDFANALRVASELRTSAQRDECEMDVFNAALEFYISGNRYEELAAFIDELEGIKTFKLTAAEVINAAIDCCSSLNDNAGIIYLAKQYPDKAQISSTQAYIAPGDSGVRAELEIIYPMLSAKQKRAYHAQPISVWNGQVRVIQNGRIAGIGVTSAVSIDTNEKMSLILHENGSVSAVALSGELPFAVPEYNDVVEIALGESHAVFLHDNGRVSAVGDNTYGQCSVGGWCDIVAVAAGQNFTLGLKIDGTVLAAGHNSAGQCSVSGFNNVVDVAACAQTAVLLFEDGTVMIRGYRSMGLSKVESEQNITRISAGGSAIVVERRDGTYASYSGSIRGSSGDPGKWKDLRAFDVGLSCIAGVNNSGAICADGDGIAK